MAIKNIVKLSDLEFGNRIDGELYNPFLKVSHNLLLDCGYPIKRLRDACKIKSGTTPIDRDDSLREGPILFKTTDIRNTVLDPYSNYYHINGEIFERMSSTKLETNDVLLNIVGATLDVIGRSAYTSSYFEKANITQAMVLLRIKNSIKPGFLFSYLNTKYAQDQIKRYARPTGQYNLNLTEVGHIAIPIFNITDQESIQNTVEHSGLLQKKSSDFYKQAIDLLEQELGLDKITFEKKKSYVASFSEVVNNNRSDAEYFDIKFKPLLDTINSYKNGVKSIRETSNRINTNYNFKSSKNEEITYIEIGDINVDDGSFDFKTIKAENVPANAKIKLSGGEILISMVRPTRGAISIVPEIEENSTVVCSGAFYVINTKELEKREIIWLYFRLFKSVFEKYCGGSSYPTLDSKYLDSFPVPNFNNQISKKISDLISISIKNKRESKRLLEEAKTRVEQLIEEAANK